MVHFKKEFEQLYWVKYKEDIENSSLDRALVSFLLVQIR